MSRTVAGSNVAVILRVLVMVPHYHGDRGSGGFSLKDTGKDFHLIGFFALGGKLRLSRFPAVQIDLNILLTKGKSRRTTVHDNSDAFSVGFPPGSDFKYISKR
jgi:hypothetical protein